MGTDIYAFVEICKDDKWEYIQPCFDFRSYGIFGFLAGIRNYSQVPSIFPRKGWPKDCSQEQDIDHYGASFITLKELLDFDYEALVEDRRISKRMPEGWINGTFTVEPGKGEVMKWKDFLGENFMNEIKEIAKLDPNPENIRIVFDFDC